MNKNDQRDLESAAKTIKAINERTRAELLSKSARNRGDAPSPTTQQAGDRLAGMSAGIYERRAEDAKKKGNSLVVFVP